MMTLLSVALGALLLALLLAIAVLAFVCSLLAKETLHIWRR